jgi:hypothetical protein
MHLDRKTTINNKVIFVDGYVGGGKAMLSNIVSSIKNVEMWAAIPHIEQICNLHDMERISLEDSASLIRAWIDEATYNASLLRHSNFRYKDQSSIFKHNAKFMLLKRLLLSEGEDSVTDFLNEERVLSFQIHATSPFCRPIFRALQERLIYIRISRNPLTDYVINHIGNWTDRWGNDFRSSMLTKKLSLESSNNTTIPFFITNHEEYLESNKLEKSVIILEEWQNKGNASIDSMKEYGAEIVEVPFEKFVFEPEIYIKEICGHIGVELEKETYKEMKNQRVPRKSLADAPYLEYFYKSGWRNPKKHLTIKEEIELTEKKYKKLMSPEFLERLVKLKDDYLERYQID